MRHEAVWDIELCIKSYKYDTELILLPKDEY